MRDSKAKVFLEFDFAEIVTFQLLELGWSLVQLWFFREIQPTRHTTEYFDACYQICCIWCFFLLDNDQFAIFQVCKSVANLNIVYFFSSFEL